MTQATIENIEHSAPIRSIGLDDHPEEFSDGRKIMREFNIPLRVHKSVEKFGKVAKKASSYDILISDNQIENMGDLEIIGHEEIDTEGGTCVGRKILTKFCEVEKIAPGLRILFTQYNIPIEVEKYFERMRKKDQEIFAFRKDINKDIDEFRKVISKFKIKKQSQFVTEKFDYIQSRMDEWDMTENERCLFFGFRSADDPGWKGVKKGCWGGDIEARCDLINRLKVALETVFGFDDLDQEKRWLRTKIPANGNLSPIEYVRSSYQHKLAELVLKVEGK